MTGEAERPGVEEALRRVDDLVAGLSHVADPAARETARRLVEAVLDLHGLALARIMAMAAGEADGGALLRRIGDDEHIRAVLLLYGLHPDEPRTRIRQALDRLRPALAAAGIGAEMVRTTGTTASVRLACGGAVPDALRRQVEEAIGNAVPDLDDIAIEWLDEAGALPAAAAAG